VLSQIFNLEFLGVILRLSTPLLFAAMGNVISDRAGVTNIAMEGSMTLAAFSGVVLSAFTKSAWIGALGAVLISVLYSLFLGYLSLYLKTNIIMAGIALNTFASSFTVFLLYMITGQKANSASLASKQLPRIEIPVIRDIPVLREILSGHNVLVYGAILSIVVVYFLLQKTRLGMHIRAVGENETAACSVGIKTKRVQMIALGMSGMIAGLGGVYMSMGYLSIFSNGMIAGRGWIGIAASAMGRAHVIPTTISVFLFGIFDSISNQLQLGNVPAELVMTLPYVVVIIGLVVYSMQRQKKEKKHA
jgi:simple sugar transport system permease protein